MRMKRFQFGLRALMVLAVVCALFTAWVVSLRRQAIDERNAIHEAQMMGASVSVMTPDVDSRWVAFKSWLAGGPLDSRIRLSFQNQRPLSNTFGPYGPDGKLVQLHEWNEANILTLGPVFRRLRGLESISFWRSPLPSGSLESILPASRRINYVNVSAAIGQSPGMEIGPGDFAALSRLPNLERLDLSSTNVTDDDLVHIAKLDLKLLRLQDTRITDEGIRILADMKHLEDVDLGLTRVTEDVVPILAKWQVKKKLLVPAEWSYEAVNDLHSKLPFRCDTRKTGYHFRSRPNAKAY